METEGLLLRVRAWRGELSKTQTHKQPLCHPPKNSLLGFSWGGMQCLVWWTCAIRFFLSAEPGRAWKRLDELGVFVLPPLLSIFYLASTGAVRAAEERRAR